MLAVFALAGVGRAAGPPACRIAVDAAPQPAFVGQQIVYTVRITRREDVSDISWESPLVFADFRSEWLPGGAEGGATREQGASYRTRTEARALFATRAGRFRVAGARVHCALPKADGDPTVLQVPGVEIEVRAPPAAGRPEGFAGVIGPLTLRARADADRVALGSAVGVSLLVRGDGDLWSLPSPSAAWEADVDVFARDANVTVEPGDRLYLRRFFRFDVVPRSVGMLTIPGFRVVYYDPAAAHYGVAETRPIVVAVVPADARPQARDRGVGGDAPSEEASPESRRGWLAPLLAVFAAAALGLGLWRLGARPRFADATAAWSEADAAAGSGAETAALARALRLAEAALEGAPDTPERREAARQRAQLDAVRFSRDVIGVDGDAARRALRALGVPAPGGALRRSRK